MRCICKGYLIFFTQQVPIISKHRANYMQLDMVHPSEI